MWRLFSALVRQSPILVSQCIPYSLVNWTCLYCSGSGQGTSSSKGQNGACRGKLVFYSFNSQEFFEVGLHVDIQRSDGRVHGAVISDIKRDKGVVTVEWFEKVSSFHEYNGSVFLQGETKGKEIEWNLLLKINPTLMGTGKPQLSQVGDHPSKNNTRRGSQILSQSQINGNDLDETILLGNNTPAHPPPARQKVHSFTIQYLIHCSLILTSIVGSDNSSVSGGPSSQGTSRPCVSNYLSYCSEVLYNYQVSTQGSFTE